MYDVLHDVVCLLISMMVMVIAKGDYDALDVTLDYYGVVCIMYYVLCAMYDVWRAL